MRERRPTSRWRASATTLGPTGRLVTTGIALLPVWWLFATSVVSMAVDYQIGFGFAACIWTLFVVPMMLRDIWKKVPDPEGTPVLEVDEEPRPIAPGESILDRPSPTRW